METIGISGGGDTPPTQKELCHVVLSSVGWFKSASGPLFRRPFQPAELGTCELRRWHHRRSSAGPDLLELELLRSAPFSCCSCTSCCGWRSSCERPRPAGRQPAAVRRSGRLQLRCLPAEVSVRGCFSS